jgi:hypothetical protein
MDATTLSGFSAQVYALLSSFTGRLKDLPEKVLLQVSSFS